MRNLQKHASLAAAAVIFAAFKDLRACSAAPLATATAVSAAFFAACALWYALDDSKLSQFPGFI
jgi:hypothetical protein